jgi:copper chaperone CopZ
VQSNARFLLTAIKNATGMSAQEMNSIPELQALQEAVTKPTQSIQSIRNIIANVDKLYGTGGLKIDVAPKTEAAPKTDDKPKIAKLSDIEHTAKLKKLSIEEVKKRVRDLGMTIEGE